MIPTEVQPAPGQYQCVACGACCAAPDIAALKKPLGVPCRHLGPDQLCGIYEDRPAVCRNYRPDWVCAEVAPLPTLEARVKKFLEIYGLWEEFQRDAANHGVREPLPDGRSSDSTVTVRERAEGCATGCPRRSRSGY